MGREIHRWKNIQLIEDDVVLPNNKAILHTTIVHPGAAIILPITDDGKIVVTHQYRPSVKRWVIEIPAGTLEPGEEPINCAERELEEETGFSAQNFIPLGELVPLAGFCDETQYLFIARQLQKTDRLECDEDEVINVRSYSVTEMESLIVQNEITDSKTIAALYRAKLAGYLSD